MRMLPRKLVAGVLAGSCLLSSTGAEEMLPASVAPQPGRLVGWGRINAANPVEATIPEGWLAEGYVQLAASDNFWHALHQDGWVLTSDGERIRFPVPIRQMEGGKYRWIALLADGTVRTAPSARCRPAPDGLGEVIQVAAGNWHFAALCKTGELVIWDKEDADREPKLEEALGNFPRSGVKGVQSCGMMIGVTLRDGSHHGVNLQTRKEYTAKEIGAPVAAFAPGYFHFLGLSPEGAPLAWGGSSYAVSNGAATVPPGLQGPFVRVAAYESHSYLQRPDGSWVFWGNPRHGQDDVARLQQEDLLAFQVGGQDYHSWGYLIGIRRSLAYGIDSDITALPEAKKALGELSNRLQAAANKVEAFEERYLQELAKLEGQGGIQPALLELLKEEKNQFRDRTRPLSSNAALARLQTVYRKRIPALEKERESLRVEALQFGVATLQQQQDQLTQENRLTDAVECRRVKEELSRVASLPRTEMGEPILPQRLTSISGTDSFLFPEIAPKDRIFRIGDPVRPGKLVAHGEMGSEPYELPRPAQRESFVELIAGTDCWIARQEDGRFHCDGSFSRFTTDRAPGEVGRLSHLHYTENNRGTYATNRSGKLVHWAAATSWMETLPKETEEWTGVVDLSLLPADSGGTKFYQQLLALHEDGSVSATGEFYTREKFPWKNLAAGSTDNVAVVAATQFGGVLKRDGSILLWNDEGPINLRPELKDVVQVSASDPKFGVFLALRKDGSVTGYNSATGKAPDGLPKGLSEVVEIVRASGQWFVLRADGRWYGWEAIQSPKVREIPEMRGVRQLGVGGDRESYFLIGIRPEAS